MKKYQCPCCGYFTYNVPANEDCGYICPVCFWENDPFIASDNEPSDSNHGITLKEAKLNFSTFGACEKEMVCYVRLPRDDEKEISFSGAASQNMACFVAGTLILTTAGLLAIEKLRAGDKVLAADPESFEVGEKTILEAFERKVYKLVHLTINGEKIVTTDNHPFYVQGRGFIKAEGLFVGDKLISVDGKDLIVETHDIEQCEKPITVYNFKVEDYHTYFVGNCKIWVHNNDCVKKVESGEIELETKKQKGNYGEMKMDEHYDSKGFEKMHNGVESLDDKIHHGIDGVYKNKDPNGDPKFIIAEAKYGSSQLGNTKKSGPQMGDKWIKNNIGKIVDDPDDIIEGLATGDTVKELFRVNVSNDNGLVNVTTSVKSLK